MKIDRRALLKKGALVSGATLISRFAAAASFNEVALDRFIVDSRVPGSIVAGRLAVARGAKVSEVDGDLTALWYDDLNLKWQQRPMSLAGITGEDALFVLSTLAPQYGMRVKHQEVVGLIEGVPRSSLAGDSLSIYSWMIAPA